MTTHTNPHLGHYEYGVLRPNGWAIPYSTLHAAKTEARRTGGQIVQRWVVTSSWGPLREEA